MKNFLSIREFASFLSVSTSTIRRMVESGELACIKVRKSIRIPSETLNAFSVSLKTTTTEQGEQQNG